MSKKVKENMAFLATKDIEFLKAHIETLYRCYLVSYKNEMAIRVFESPVNKEKLEDHFLISAAEVLGIRGAKNNWAILSKAQLGNMLQEFVSC